MLATVVIYLWGLAGVYSLSNLPNGTQVKLDVVVDAAFIRSEGATNEQIEEVIRSALISADQSFAHGEFTEVEWIDYSEIQDQYGEGIL